MNEVREEESYETNSHGGERGARRGLSIKKHINENIILESAVVEWGVGRISGRAREKRTLAEIATREGIIGDRNGGKLNDSNLLVLEVEELGALEDEPALLPGLVGATLLGHPAFAIGRL